MPVGLTCNSFASVSLDPPLVLWSLRRESQSLRAFSEAPAFAINVLAEDQNTLSAHFASGKIADKFEGVACSAGYGGVPLIEECIARFECSTFARHEAGDHVIFIGRVERFDVGSSEDALVFYKGAYMMLTESLRELTSKGRISDDALDEARTLVYGMLLRLGCERGTDADFDAIEGLLGQMECLVDSSDMPARAHKASEFFELLARAAHNEVLAIVARSLSTLVYHAIAAKLPTTYRADVAAARADILVQLRARDAEAAVGAMAHYASIVRQDTTAAT